MARTPEDPAALAAEKERAGYKVPPQDLQDAIGTSKLGSPAWRAIEAWFKANTTDWMASTMCFIADRYGDNLTNIYVNTDGHFKDALGLRGYN